MRRSALAILLAFGFAGAANAAALPSRPELRTLDVTGSDLAGHVASLARGTLARRHAAQGNGAAFGAPAPIPGWTITQIGDTVYLQDDGSHGCDADLSNQWFDTCLAGTNSALEAFYASYPDANPGYASFYLAWDIDAFFAFYAPIANDVAGIGQQKFGNVSSLNGLIFMNSVQLYRSYGPDNRAFLFDLIWGQEFGHRWGSFVRFIDDEGRKSKDLLGRDDAHWSYFLDTGWSWMEGNDWRDNGDGSFTTDFDSFGQPGQGYSPLDLYLMGLIPPSGVPDFFYIRDPETNARPEDPPQIMYGAEKTIRGKKARVSLDQVIEAEGERSPAYHQTRRWFQVANIVVLRSTDSIASVQDDMDDYTAWSSSHFARDTFELAHVETTIGTPLPNQKPVASLQLPAEAKEDGAAVTLDASASSDPEGEKLSFVWDFGDGTADYTSGPVVSHVFRKHGDLSVTVVAVDARGQAHSTSGTLSVARSAEGGDRPVFGCRVASTTGAVPPAAAVFLALEGAMLLALGRPIRRAAGARRP